jgi:Zn finger protein HypA/HybF involved in hydrogenase expression
MVDMSAIGIVMSSLNAAVNITKAMKDVHDATVLDAKVFELQRAMLDTQSAVFAVNEERSALIERVGALEKEISDLREWETEKQKYELKALDSTGVYAYARKAIPGDTEPHHFLCANCYQNGQKSILQATVHLAMRKRVHFCPRCKSEIAFGHVEISNRPARAITDYDIFKDV